MLVEDSHRVGERVMTRLAIRCSLVVLLFGFGDDVICAEIDVFVRLIEEAETPAREPGVLTKVVVKEGQMVAEGEVLAQIEDIEAQFNRNRAELELRIAREEADSDVIVRTAEKAAVVARNEWQRVKKIAELNPNAISASEVENHQLTAEKLDLEVERAERDFRLAKIKLALKENEFDFSEEKLVRHVVIAPLPGMVVEVHRRRGEWVEPGEKVFRIVRIDRLRAEGFVDASQVSGEWIDSQVVLSVRLNDDTEQEFTGTVVFVSPEIDPVNGQVAVWAEVENANLLLRPGLRATMTVGSTQHSVPDAKD